MIQDICKCGATKRVESRLCRNCWLTQQKQQSTLKLVCGCGKPKSMAAKRCKDCYRAKHNHPDDYNE